MHQLHSLVVALGALSVAVALPSPFFTAKLQAEPVEVLPPASSSDLQEAASQWLPDAAVEAVQLEEAKEKEDDLQVAEFNWAGSGTRSGWGNGQWGNYGSGGPGNGFGPAYGAGYGNQVNYGGLGANYAYNYNAQLGQLGGPGYGFNGNGGYYGNNWGR